MRKGFWESYGVLDGLPAVELLAILEDRQGHLWFGTAGGASQYDGQSFVNFSTEDGLAHNQVNSILQGVEINSLRRRLFRHEIAIDFISQEICHTAPVLDIQIGIQS